MKKYLSLFSCLVLLTNSATALTSSQQLDAMKEIFIKEFQKIDTNSDGKLSQDEYLNAQFENFRANIIEADGFNINKNKAPQKPQKDEKELIDEKTIQTKNNDLVGIPQALQEMADYDINLDELGISEEDLITPPLEEESLQDIIADMKQDDKTASSLADITSMDDVVSKDMTQPEPITENIENDKNSHIAMMMDTIRKTLPKKIDEITTWTDIEYKDNTIAYIYQADIDTSAFSNTEKQSLNQSIENEACAKAYQEMCPRIKVMFIDEGINMQIRYFDKSKNELSSCEFNQTTCQ